VTRTHPLDLQRLHHVPDELLRSRDLRDQLAYDAELLWWHQRAVHDAGVAVGLGLLDVGTPHQIGVAPGIGYEGSGRDVRLLEATTIAVPAADHHAMALVLRRRSAGTELVWIAASDVDRCRGVPVALLRRYATVPEPWPARARTVARPRIGWGATPPDSTPWEPWEPAFAVRGLQVRIDARAAGFTAVPCYFAALQGEIDGLRRAQILPLGRQYVEAETIDGFTFRVLVAFDRRDLIGLVGPAIGTLAAGTALAGYGAARRLWVSWLGLQCDAAAPSAMSLKDVMR
jgi:hypothetical protein